MADTPGILLSDVTSALRRRGWIIVLCVMVLAPLALGVAYVLPPVYSATARILVEGQQIPETLARSTVTNSAAERIELVKQRLLTRQNLIRLIEEQDLYSDRPELSLSDKVDRLRASTGFEIMQFAGGRDGSGLAAFTITVRANQPVLSASVANQFVTMALNQNAESRRERATDTVNFFDQEVRDLGAEIDALEKRILAFKRENAAALPDSLAFRRSEVRSLEEQIYDRQQRLIVLEEDRRELTLRLEGGGRPTEAQLTPQERQIRDLENSLAQRLATLTPTHPQIIALEARIAALKAGPQVASADGEETASRAAEFERRRLERQIDLADEQITLIDERQEEARERVIAMRETIGATPRVEIQLNALERRFANLQAQYATAVAKQADARTGEKLEINRQAERFVVIEQAQTPENPQSPNRTLIAAGGGGASLALGVGLVVLLELLNRSIRTTGDLQRRVQLRPVVIVPYIRTRSELWRRRVGFMLFAGLVLIGVPALLFAIDTYYLPLEVLAESFMRRSGLENAIRLIENRL